MMRAVKHKNIMRLYELYEGENYIYCLTEFLAGGQLLDYIRDSEYLTESQSLNLLRQLIEVYSYFIGGNCSSSFEKYYP